MASPRLSVLIVHVYLLTVLCVQFRFTAAQQTSVCTPISPDTDPGNELPRLPETFQTNIELNIVNKRETIEAYVSFDLPNNRSALRMLQDVRETTSYVDFNTNEVNYVYEKTKCTTAPLDTTAEGLIFGKLRINGVSYSYSVMSALKFGREFGQKFMGQTTIRGIMSNHWQSCQYIDNPPARYIVDYYFAIPEWSQTLGATAMPVRAIFKGTSTQGARTNQPFTHIYDFLNFQPYADKDYNTYQTPDGVYCKDRKTTRPAPKIPPSFRYRTEVVQPLSTLSSGIIFNMDLWYDYDHKLGRYDFGLPIPVSFIFDYGVGVRYMKAVREKTCKMVGFGVWSQEKPGNNQLIWEMLDPERIFFLDDSYVYTGKAIHRGIPCDRYISNLHFNNSIGITWNMTMEYCFIDPTYVEIGDSATTITRNVPLTAKMITKLEAGSYEAAMNHFDFESIDWSDDMQMFDVAECYKPGDKKNIRITFEANYLEKIAEYKGKFISDVIARIAKVAHMSPIRVQRPRVDYDATNTYFTSTLLERVPYDVLFRPNEDGDNVGLVSVDDNVANVRFEQLCAEMCQDLRDDQGKSIKCNSFAYCFADNRCLMSTNHVARPGTVNIGKYCRADTVKYYNRVVPAPDVPDVRLHDAMSSLKTSILSGRFNIYFKPTDGESLHIYRATTIDVGFSRADSKGTVKYMKDFNQFAQRTLAPEYFRVEIDSDLSVDECAAACERKDTFVCQAFAFCASVGKCILAAEHPEEKDDMLVNSTSCDTYSRNYLQKFKHYMGKSLAQNDAMTVKDVSSSDRCAMLCVTQKGWSCKSFDYCATSRTCRLNKKHVLDLPAREGKLKPAPNCDHFSRLYIDDFRQTSSGAVIPLSGVNIIRDVDMSQCAKLCVDNLGNECKGFDFCGNQTFCVLSSKYYREKGVGKVISRNNAFCARYTRTSFPDGNSYVPPNIDTGYTGGALAGIGFGMMVLGMLLTVIIAAVVMKARGASNDNMKTALMTIANPR